MRTADQPKHRPLVRIGGEPKLVARDFFIERSRRRQLHGGMIELTIHPGMAQA
jgi:hypothetical protein